MLEVCVFISLEHYLYIDIVISFCSHWSNFPDDSKLGVHVIGELKQSIRQEMEKNSGCNDKQKIRYLISEGLEKVKRLDEMLDMQGH